MATKHAAPAYAEAGPLEPSADETTAALWEGDTGTLPYDARRALLRLIRGPYLEAGRNGELWRALLNHQQAIASRLNDLFLELVVDDASGLAFVRNAAPEELEVPQAVRTQSLTVLDTAMVLTLRRELLNSGFGRAIIGKEDFLAQMAPYRPIAKLDEAAFAKRLEASWNKLADAGLLQRTDAEGRWEISPVLKLMFGADEVRAVADEFERLLEEGAEEGLDARQTTENAGDDGEGAQ